MTVAIAAEFATRVKRNEPMSRHTSWHVGGPAEVFFTPRDRTDLAAFLRSLRAEVPIHWVGLGSNLLVRDGGVAGVVISTQGALDRLDRVSEMTVYCQAGVPCARRGEAVREWGFGHAEFFAGIPGTLGGALAMNAGAFGTAFAPGPCAEPVRIAHNDESNDESPGDTQNRPQSPRYNVGAIARHRRFPSWPVA